MSVYVDRARMPLGRMLMSHMMADTVDELHAMAECVGLRRAWFQRSPFPHYDLCQARRQKAIAAGAIVVGRRDLALAMRGIREAGDGRLTDSSAKPSVLSQGAAVDAGGSVAPGNGKDAPGGGCDG